ncbi:transglycosylase SLT domain-containing protein [Methylophilus sp. YYY-1]|uniref:transglycosylase SLT domain-containing protein n=1 Tax=Methylophilus sp. YYY-1 TaxID=2682087 RepID=UPI0023B27793|nr:transglycosylase SLT domain-containing protein [Methylophilus sp. YYY-1]
MSKPDSFYWYLLNHAGTNFLCKFMVFYMVAILVGVLLAFSPNVQAAGFLPSNAIKYRRELTRLAHAEWGLNAPIPVFAAQIHQESTWNPAAVSAVGAQGMAQFMPDTAKWLCESSGTAASQCLPQNPVWSMRALMQYDKWLYARVWGLNDYDRMWATLRAYNGGLGWWQREALMAPAKRMATREEIDSFCGKNRRHVMHCKENLAYPHRIMNIYQPRYSGWGRIIIQGGQA